MLHHHLPHHLC